MPGLQGETVMVALGSPIKKSKLSLKFFQKKETKRALDFNESPIDEPKAADIEEDEPAVSHIDQVIPLPEPCPASPIPLMSCEKSETVVPFSGLNNLGNTCYLNSILQVLYYCPGLRDGIKKLHRISTGQDKTKAETKEESSKSDLEEEGSSEEALPAHMELLGDFNSLITSMEQLQSSFLLSPVDDGEGDLATAPRKVLNTLRKLNPMYEGYQQHDAQELLQCILGYIQDACVTIRKEKPEEKPDENVPEVKPESTTCVSSSDTATTEEEGQSNGKRKSDTEVGNAKKKPKSVKSDAEPLSRPMTRSKRKSSSDITACMVVLSHLNTNIDDGAEKKDGEEQDGSDGEEKGDKTSKKDEGKRKKRNRLAWLRPSGKQPSIFSKFRSMGKLSSTTVAKNQDKPGLETGPDTSEKTGPEPASPNTADNKKTSSQDCLDLMERLFQGRLVLRTRCLECENYTERREDFQDISVPVQEDQPSSQADLSEVSPDPKPEVKTLKWAISQFASVERISGEDKYFCETCHHYAEAERSLLFDKTPEVVTIHLKCFSANGLELDPYAGLSKVNTPLQTPLTLSLEEWCTQPSANEGRRYELFAVVMHSGVTISSGHYTTYIRMSDLKDTRLWPQGENKVKTEEVVEGEAAGEPKQKEESTLDYDDGEVSFSLRGRAHSNGDANTNSASSISGKKACKKSSDGAVGLLGGQRSVSDNYELTNGSSKQPEGSRRRQNTISLGQNTENELKKEPEADEGAQGSSTAVCGGGVEATEQQVLNRLLEYEGKWLLFDDSEVRLFEEEDFLRACSPKTCTTSTPYLLFYRRAADPGH